jgi:hypothetical protein
VRPEGLGKLKKKSFSISHTQLFKYTPVGRPIKKFLEAVTINELPLTVQQRL